MMFTTFMLLRTVVFSLHLHPPSPFLTEMHTPCMHACTHLEYTTHSFLKYFQFLENYFPVTINIHYYISFMHISILTVADLGSHLQIQGSGNI